MSVEDIHIFQPINFEEIPDEDKVEWSKGYLTMTCHNCGNEEMNEVPTEGGVKIILPVTNHHEIKLVCSQCNSAMSLHYVKAEGAEEVKQAEINKVKDEPEEDSKAE